MTYRKLIQALDRERIDYQIVRGTVTSLKGKVFCTDGIDILVNPSQKNLKGVGKAAQSFRGTLRVYVRPTNVSSKKRRMWYVPTNKELFAYTKLSVEEKLGWLEEASREICQIKPRKN